MWISSSAAGSNTMNGICGSAVPSFRSHNVPEGHRNVAGRRASNASATTGPHRRTMRPGWGAGTGCKCGARPIPRAPAGAHVRRGDGDPVVPPASGGLHTPATFPSALRAERQPLFVPPRSQHLRLLVPLRLRLRRALEGLIHGHVPARALDGDSGEELLEGAACFGNSPALQRWV